VREREGRGIIGEPGFFDHLGRPTGGIKIKKVRKRRTGERKVKGKNIYKSTWQKSDVMKDCKEKRIPKVSSRRGENIYSSGEGQIKKRKEKRTA
jgi:hypothetical protein